MTAHYIEPMFTPEVLRQQEGHGSRPAYGRLADEATGTADALGPREQMFLAMRDSFYLASTSANGWPYVQHRGGPPGFVKLIDERTIGFADYRGNRQYVSLGNIATDDRVGLFFMDYTRRARMKVLGRMRAVDLRDTPDLSTALTDPSYPARVERGFVIAVEAFDWNCPQHITPRFNQAELDAHTAPLHRRIAELEATLREEAP